MARESVYYLRVDYVADHSKVVPKIIKGCTAWICSEEFLEKGQLTLSLDIQTLPSILSTADID